MAAQAAAVAAARHATESAERARWEEGSNLLTTLTYLICLDYELTSGLVKTTSPDKTALRTYYPD